MREGGGAELKEQIIQEINSIDDVKLLQFLYKFIVSMKKYRVHACAADQSGHKPGICDLVSDHEGSAHDPSWPDRS